MDERQRFRWLGFAEGVSFLLLLGIAMPLKYVFDIPMAVKVVGWAHGVLFLGYLFGAIQLGALVGWPLRRYVAAFAAALLPFGPFIFDRRLEQPEGGQAG